MKIVKRDLKSPIALLLIFAIALFIRIYFNYDIAVSRGVVGGGSDPWYHLRIIEYILANGNNLVWDSMLNYPLGWHNPRPPGFTFSIAIFAKIFAPILGGIESSKIAMFVAYPAIFGALTIFPVYFIGKKFGKKAGILSATFLAINAIHITVSSAANSDYDSFNLFFSTMAILFFLLGLDSLKRTNEPIEKKFPRIDGTIFREEAFKFSIISGIFVGIVALSWEGFVYLYLILFAYLGIVLMTNHIRRKSSLRVFILSFTAMLLGTLISAPYYLMMPRMDAWLISLVVVGAALAAFLIFSALRNVPWLLLFPGIIAMLLLGLIALKFIMPEIAQLILTGWGYFGGNPVYRTIAEAQPPSIGYFAFSMGPLTFFLAFVAVAFLVKKIWKKWDLCSLFLLIWFLLACFMASSALRFVFTAVPAFSIATAIVVSWFIDLINFGSFSKNFSRTRKNGVFFALRKSMKIRHIIGAVVIVCVILLPNALLAVDAGTSYDWERENDDWYAEKLMGAFGASLLDKGWIEAMDFLANNCTERYNEPLNEKERPGVASWWDYGFYIIELGKHPACADPFQNGYLWASRFLLSQNETHALQMIAGRIMEDGDIISKNRSVEIMNGIGIENGEMAYENITSYEYTEYIDEEQAVELISALKDETGKSIEYFLTTYEEIGIMLPYHMTPGKSLRIVQLSGFDEDDFIHEWYGLFRERSTSLVYIPEEPWMTSYRKISDPEGTASLLNKEEAERYAKESVEKCARAHVAGGYVAQFALFGFTDNYVNSTLYGLYMGVDPVKHPDIGDYVQIVGRAPTYNLKHFKMIFDNYLVSIARYYPGANVTGTVLDANNDPISGLTVEIMDENGTPHDHTITDEKGRYSLTAIEGNLTIAATMKGGMIAENRIDVTHEQAMRQVDYRIKSDIKVTAKEFKGSLVGRAFIDNNQNMIFDEDEGDTLATNGTVTIISQEDYSLLRSMAGETQEAQLRAMMGISVITANITDGAFKFEDIDVGGYAVFVSSNEYAGTSFAVINAGKETEVDVPLAHSPEEAAQFLQFSQLGQMGQLGNLGQLGQPGQPGNLGQLGQLANILNQSAGEENITTETVPIETPEPIQEDEPIPEEKPE